MLVKNTRWQFGILYVFLCAIGLIEPVRHDVNEMMYVNIPGGAACFRRLNGTHQFGCSSPPRGTYGVIQVVYSMHDVEQFIKNAVAGPYVVVVPPPLFSRSVMDSLVRSDIVSGVIIAKDSNSTFPDHYSPDNICPNNRDDSCDSKHPWNPYGNNFLMTDWPFPIFVVNDDAYLINITQCYKEFNLPLDASQLTRPLCMLQLKSHMYGAVSSEVCMRRLIHQLVVNSRFCDPLGNENIVFPMVKHSEAKDNKLIAVIARLDGASLFDGIAPGAMSAVSGTATLIVLANIINDLLGVIRSHTVHKGITFILLNGESFDYIGSQRVVYDMEQGTFMSPNYKITLDDIGMIIDLSQLGPHKTFYIHHTSDNDSTEFANNLNRISKNMSLDFKSSLLLQNRLPPVSLNTFLDANKNISGIVVTNYNQNFTNNYYNGMFDTAENLDFHYGKSKSENDLPPHGSTQYNLAAVSVVLARSIIPLMINDESVTFDIKLSKYVETIDDILYCFLRSRKCKYFQKLYPGIASNTKGPDVLSLYVGVFNSVSHITRATSRLLAYLASPFEEKSQENCTAQCTPDDEVRCFWVKEDDGVGKCIMSTARLLQSVSPAFEIEDYDWTSKKYSTWTESVWTENSVRMFIKGEHRKDIVIFVIGLMILVLSSISVYIISKKSNTLFSPKLQPENC